MAVNLIAAGPLAGLRLSVQVRPSASQLAELARVVRARAGPSRRRSLDDDRTFCGIQWHAVARAVTVPVSDRGPALASRFYQSVIRSLSLSDPGPRNQNKAGVGKVTGR